MIIRILAILGLIMCFVSPEDASGQIGKIYTLKKHRVIINGQTNINTFSCKLELDSVSENLHVVENRSQDHIAFKGLDLKLPIDEFQCGNAMMNADLRSLLSYEEHPFLELKLQRIDLRKPSKGGDMGSYSINALITIADVTRTEIFEDSHIENVGDLQLFKGSHQLLLTDYQIEPPRKFFGTVKVKDEIDIEFELHIYQSSE